RNAAGQPGAGLALAWEGTENDLARRAEQRTEGETAPIFRLPTETEAVWAATLDGWLLLGADALPVEQLLRTLAAGGAPAHPSPGRTAWAYDAEAWQTSFPAPAGRGVAAGLNLPGLRFGVFPIENAMNQPGQVSFLPPLTTRADTLNLRRVLAAVPAGVTAFSVGAFDWSEIIGAPDWFGRDLRPLLANEAALCEESGGEKRLIFVVSDSAKLAGLLAARTPAGAGLPLYRLPAGGLADLLGTAATDSIYLRPDTDGTLTLHPRPAVLTDELFGYPRWLTVPRNRQMLGEIAGRDRSVLAYREGVSVAGTPEAVLYTGMPEGRGRAALTAHRFPLDAVAGTAGPAQAQTEEFVLPAGVLRLWCPGGEPPFYAQDENLVLYQISAAGERLWEYPVLDTIVSDLFQAGRGRTARLYFHTDRAVHLLDANLGTVITAPLDDGSRLDAPGRLCTFAGAGQALYLVGDETGTLRGFDFNGQPAAGWDPGPVIGRLADAPVHLATDTADYIFVPDRSGGITAFNRSGSIRWQRAGAAADRLRYLGIQGRSSTQAARLAGLTTDGRVRIFTLTGETFGLPCPPDTSRPRVPATAFAFLDLTGDKRFDYLVANDRAAACYAYGPEKFGLAWSRPRAATEPTAFFTVPGTRRFGRIDRQRGVFYLYSTTNDRSEERSGKLVPIKVGDQLVTAYGERIIRYALEE
ncbi:MAG: hypothetical protein WBA17_12450, partial [Saprospiraceae bacterium]